MTWQHWRILSPFILCLSLVACGDDDSGAADAGMADALVADAPGVDAPTADGGVDAGGGLCPGDCDPLAGCTEMGGAAVCGDCPTGYEDTAGDGTDCADIDECADDPCTDRQDCTNTAGSFECACAAPFVAVGADCVEPIADVVIVAPSDITTTSTGAFCLEAACTGDRVILSGGHFAALGDVTSSQRMDGSTWEACFRGEVAGINYGVDAVCGQAPGGVTPVDRGGSVSTGETCLRVVCEEGLSAVGGGGRWPAHANLVSSRQTMEGRAWNLCVQSSTGGGIMNVSAQCVAVGTQVRSATGSSSALTATCEAGETRVGGGGSADFMAATVPTADNGWEIQATLGDARATRAEAICVGPF